MALLARMRRQGRFQGKLHVCVTDYQAHGFWADPEVDQYYVATPEAGQRLAGWGVHPCRIMETGIPARKRFARVASAARRAGESLNVLFMTSSLKERECRKLLREMSESGPPLSVTVIGGRNHSLLRALASYAPGPHMRLTMKGHVDNLECLMAESDLVVTKPGGIHALRHAYASHQLAAGLNVERLQRLMGHSTINTTLRYVHWVPSAREGEGELDLIARLEGSDA